MLRSLVGSEMCIRDRALNRVDVVDLDADLVDVDLDVDLVDVDLDVDLVDVDLVDLGKRRFPFLLMLPCGRPRP